MHLRKEARGRECMVRLPECNDDAETTVLAHIRLPGVSGFGMKAPDILGSWCCSNCHRIVDSRASFGYDKDFTELALFEGMARTINQLVKEEKIKW